jgi:hypothetical protein
VRYYVYVSETKVNQLYAQIPTKLRDKIAAKFTIDLKLVKGEFEGRQPQESLFSKLDIVRTFLDEEGLIGSVDNPNSFFGETMPLNWGPYGVGSEVEEVEGFPPQDESLDPQLVYFGGRTQETIVGLGGSMKHVVGELGRTHSHSHSATPYLTRALREATRESAVDRGIDVDEATALECVELASAQMGGPWEPMEFVAKRLAHGVLNRRVWWNEGGSGEDLGQVKAILGTPLYVSMAD